MNESKTIAQGLVGAAVGGIIGYFGFFFITRYGFYAMVLPGALLGMGAGLCAQRRSIPLAMLCGIAALLLGLYTEWKFAPFIVDGSLGYLVAHVTSINTIHLVMIGLGTFLGFRLALGPKRQSESQEQKSA